MEPKLDHYIGIYDTVVDHAFCKKVIDKFESIYNHSVIMQKIEGGGQFDEGKLGRSDKSIFFERESPEIGKEINTAVGKCVEDYREKYLGLQNLTISSHCAKVQKTGISEGYHVWHTEHGGDISSMRRVLVWILYLTDHEGSGETEFLQQGMRVEPRAGRVVLWPAGYTHPHRGNPVYDKDKYIATGWFEHH